MKKSKGEMPMTNEQFRMWIETIKLLNMKSKSKEELNEMLDQIKEAGNIKKEAQ